MYRGRRLRLVVELADVDAPEVEYRNAFHIRAPRELGERARDRTIGVALTSWMKARVEDDAATFVRRHAVKLEVTPAGLRIKDQQHLWGSCGKDGVINLNWQLVFTPKVVLEYVVVHELCHLLHRNHSAEFWRRVGGVLPDYLERKKWIDAQGAWNL